MTEEEILKNPRTPFKPGCEDEAMGFINKLTEQGYTPQDVVSCLCLTLAMLFNECWETDTVTPELFAEFFQYNFINTAKSLAKEQLQ